MTLSVLMIILASLLLLLEVLFMVIDSRCLFELFLKCLFSGVEKDRWYPLEACKHGEIHLAIKALVPCIRQMSVYLSIYLSAVQPVFSELLQDFGYPPGQFQYPPVDPAPITPPPVPKVCIPLHILFPACAPSAAFPSASSPVFPAHICIGLQEEQEERQT